MPLGIGSWTVKLDRLLSQPGWTEERLVAAVRRGGLRKTSQSTVNRLRNGKRVAGLALALAIEAATGGQVKAEELPISRRTRSALRGVRASGQGASSSTGAAA